MKLRTRPRVHLYRRTGFTLMEIMLVVTIIALLSGMAIYRLGGVTTVGEIAKARGDILAYRTALTGYRATAGAFPSTAQGLRALVTQPEGDPKPIMWKQLSDDIKPDPWQHAYVYKCPGDRCPRAFDLYSVGEDGKAGTSDDVWQ